MRKICLLEDSVKRNLLGTLRVVLALLVSSVLWAQATAQISGTVRDQTGAVLPGVEVTVTQTDTGAARSGVTNETGTYVFPNLPIGPYRLEAALQGFRSFVQTGIVLQVNSSPVINPVLEVGQVTEQIAVEANAALVETRASSVGAVIENERILELPLNGRNALELVVMSGAAVVIQETAGVQRVQIAGGTGFGVGYSLDGADHLNFFNAVAIPMPFPDALQEFKVETSGVSSSQGNAAGVSGVTKSGTNQFHGDLFEFVRNDLFNARPYFAIKGNTLKRNQFGGTLGGPIKKDRLFFFGGYQGTTVRQDPADVEAFLPTPAMLAGDWTAFASPSCNAGRPLTLRAPFVNNRIDPAQYSKAGLNLVNKVLSQAPAPLNECGLVRFGRPARSDESQYVNRIDFQLTANHTLFGRYMALRSKSPSGLDLTPNNVLNSTATGSDNLSQSFAFGSTYLINANTVNAFRVSINRVRAGTTGQDSFNACDVGVNMYCGYVKNRMVLAITSGFNLGGNLAPGPTKVQNVGNIFQINDDVSLIRGAHQISFGASPRRLYAYDKDFWYPVGRFTINGNATGHGLGDLLTGRISQLAQGGPYYFSMNQWSFGSYVSDVWKVSSRLTVNGGLRWEPFFPQVVASGQAYNFNYDRFRQGIKSTVYPNAPAGFYYPGDPGFPGKSGANNQWFQFAPRVGIAWDVQGDGRTSVRLSYGMGYALVSGRWRQDQVQTAPWGNVTTLINPVGGLDNPWQGQLGGNPFPLATGASATFNPYGAYQSTPYDLFTPYTSTWNLAIQKQIGTDWLASATYIGTATSHLWVQNYINPAIYIPGGPCTLAGVVYDPCSQASNVNQRRRFTLERPQETSPMGSVSDIEPFGTMSYHGMLLSVQRRVARGVTVNTNYTWSHCIGDFSDLNSMGPDAGETYTNPNHREFDRGDCVGDRRQIFNFTAVARTPQFQNSTLKLLGSGWTLSGIYRRLSGAPLNVIAGSDRALTGLQQITGGQLQRGNQVSANPYADQSGRPFSNWLDRNAFDLPALGTLGNFRRNSVIGPPTWSFDMSLSRAFQIREQNRLEFRAEAFNVTNSFRPKDPNTTLTNAQFGQLRTAYDPRILQFALKFVF